MSVRTAKVFSNGGSQAVRLPAEFRFDADQVYVRRDERTGDVVLSTRPGNGWTAFMAWRDSLGALPADSPADFLGDRRQGSEKRDPFEGWSE